MSVACEYVIVEEANALSANGAKSAKEKRRGEFHAASFASFAQFADDGAFRFEKKGREVRA